MTRERQRLWAVFLVGTALATVWIAVLAYGAGRLGPTSVEAFVTDYHERMLDDGLELLIVQSDGQAFATLARDPLLRRPESFRTEEEAAYRAQRPLLGWLAAAGSLGRSGWVPPAMATIGALSTGAAAAGAGLLLRRRRRSAWFGLFVVFLPGTAGTLTYLGPEPLVLALLTWGVVIWERGDRSAAITLFALAVLGRETAILVPFALGLVLLHDRRWREATRLFVVPAVLAVWLLILQLRVGAWPWEAGDGRLGLPFAGLVEAASTLWTDSTDAGAHVAVVALVLTAAVVLGRSDRELTCIVVVHAAFATLLGRLVWAQPIFFSRPLLPMYVFGIIAAAGASAALGTGAPSGVAGRDVATTTHDSVETNGMRRLPLMVTARESGSRGPRRPGPGAS